MLLEGEVFNETCRVAETSMCSPGKFVWLGLGTVK